MPSPPPSLASRVYSSAWRVLPRVLIPDFSCHPRVVAIARIHLSTFCLRFDDPSFCHLARNILTENLDYITPWKHNTGSLHLKKLLRAIVIITKVASPFVCLWERARRVRRQMTRNSIVLCCIIYYLYVVERINVYWKIICKMTYVNKHVYIMEELYIVYIQRYFSKIKE